MNYRNLLLATFVVAGTFGLQGCTDSQIGASIGAVIGGVIGSELGDSGNHGRHERGDFERPGDRRGRHCDRYRCYDATIALDIQTEPASPTETVAAKYQISTEAAGIIVSALKKAEQRDFSELKELGFEVADFEAIYQNENPSTLTLRTMSEKLGMDLGDTNDLIQNMKADIQAERARLQLN